MNNCSVRWLLCFSACAIFALEGFAERYELKRYEQIVERQMFGQLPEGFDPTKPPSSVQKLTSKEEKALSEKQKELKSKVRFSMININPAGETMVGFTDSSDKVPRHYYLKQGESRDGWLVKEADPVKATMTIVKGDITLDLEIGGSSDKATTTEEPTHRSAPTPPPTNASSLSTEAPKSPTSWMKDTKNSKGKSWKEKREERAKREAEKDAKMKNLEAAVEKSNAAVEKSNAAMESMRQQMLTNQEELRKAREVTEAKNAELTAAMEKATAASSEKSVDSENVQSTDAETTTE